MVRSDFCVFILTHGRANNVKTTRLLERSNYTGPLYYVLDDEDDQIEEYYKNFGKDKCIVFHKDEYAFDTCDNFGIKNTITWARNECFKIAKDLGYRYFCELDDDYYYFGFKDEEGGSVIIRNIDDVFNVMVDYLANTPRLTTIALSQGGDHIGGKKKGVFHKRKAMNSFICDVERPFQFIGRFNEDVNTYTSLSARGVLFLTIMQAKLDQEDTQQGNGGITEAYKSFGTYVKGFTSVINHPSGVKVAVIRDKYARIHHAVNAEHTYPQIISEDFKK